VISEEDLAAVARSIEDPSGRALDRFLSRLIAVGRGEKRIVRVAHYGDSTIALDGITSTMRRRLQRRFGDAGHGFVLGGKGYLPYGHKDVKFFDNEQWELDTITRGGRSDGSFGYGATLFRSPGGAKTTYATVTDAPVGGEVSRFEVFFQAHRRGGKLELTVDGGEPVVVSTRTGEAEPEFVDKWHMLEVAPGPHTLVARAAGGGEVRLYGVALERGESGVVYDSLGIVGARASRLLNASAEHMAAQLRHRDLSLLVLQFGGNEAVDRSMKMDWYYNKLTEVVKFMRTAAGDVDCLLLAPLDQGERDDRGRVRTIPIVPKMIEVQRQVAQEQGCAYWDTFQAMGGEGSMGRWYDAKPRLGWGDFIHATPKGYEVIGNMLYKAVLEKLAAKL
jgi:lysophospholipase L1-like esterase